jgi:hypothetical protein
MKYEISRTAASKLVIVALLAAVSSFAPLPSFSLSAASDITLSPGKSASTSMLVRWQSKGSGKDMYVQVARMPGSFFDRTGPLKVRTVKSTYRTLRASSLGVNSSYRGRLVHSAVLSGLSPDTRYIYRIGSKNADGWSESGRFRTAPSSTGSFSFIHMTDTQPSSASETKAVISALDSICDASHEASFAVHSGDIVDNGSREAYWTGLLDGARESLMNLPVAPAAGNHDGYGSSYSVQDHFSLSSPDQTRKDGVYYSFNYGPAHFTIINTNDITSKGKLSNRQISWLTGDLSSAGTRWRIVVMHKGIYTTGIHLDDSDVMALRSQLAPLFDRYGVDLVLQGHDHVYSRTHALKNGRVSSYGKTSKGPSSAETSYSKGSGTIYLIPNTFGPKLYPLLDSTPKLDLTTFKSLFAHSLQPGSKSLDADGMPLRGTVRDYAAITVSPESISVKTHQLEGFDNTVTDMFTISR